ncbi:MAG: hypothetical protein DMG72_16650 [Acidobacteria bacterium]|nr:MAG: hypothetical protein DMG72_16650 [Acidobacteriota bacterium]
MAHSEVNDYWDIRRTAKYLGMSTGFIRKGVRQRSIPFVRIGNKALRFRKADLDRWAGGKRLRWRGELCRTGPLSTTGPIQSAARMRIRAMLNARLR